ncbi:Uncharacterised protein [Mycobacterium tuberculosis]|nr:Uncharacterised protein [Mycobacterium tuberculosis]CKS94203.1 Uncharacterised protein [Mycobacterium tuberculosis]
MRLDHTDRFGLHARRRQRRTVHGNLGVLGRHGERLRAAVLIGGRATHHGEDPITVAQRIRQSLQQHHRAALGTHKPIRVSIE